MAHKLPQWWVDAINKQEREALPVWWVTAVNKQNHTEELPEEDPEVMERNTIKAEGGFEAQLRKQIRMAEAPRFGYDSWFGRGSSGGPIAPPKNPTEMTVDEILVWQNTNNPAGAPTAAVGAYQIVDQPNARTLSGLKRTMGLNGDELFTPELQDRMADTLMEGRGLSKFLSGKMTAGRFANEIAREWAGLPVLEDDRRGSRAIRIGESYYKGDGINKTAFRGAGKQKRLDDYRDLYFLAQKDPLQLAQNEGE